MPFSFSNLLLLFPVACALGVVMAMTGGLVLKPKPDFVRTLLRISVWQMILLSLVGLLFRLTVLHILWIPLVIGFVVYTYFWQRSQTRNSVALALLATDGLPQRLRTLTHYMRTQTSGYTYRLGQRISTALESTGDWIAAAYRSGLIRGARPITAIGVLRHTGRNDFLREELKGSAEQRRLHSRWLGRIVAASLGVIPVTLVGSLFSTAFGAPLRRLLREFRTSTETWQTSLAFWVADSGLMLLFVVPLALFMFGAYVLHLFPQLTRLPLVAWFCGSYYRGITLRGLAQVLRAQPQLSTACRLAGQAVPVPAWSMRLISAAQRMENGELFATAMLRAGLISRRQSNAIALCQDANALAWALDELGTSDMDRINERVSMVVQILVVILVLISATMALIFATAIFSTLANWVSDLQP